MKTQLLIIAASFTTIAATGPAAARTVAPPAPAPMAAATASPSPTQRVCVVDTITGSRVPIKVCHTRSEWERLGVDPFAK